VKALAERVDLAIVIGTGFYREPYYPPSADIDRRTADSLADEFVKEIREGIADTGIQAGIIGEIGQHRWWISAQEERVHRAAARAAIETGLSITTHTNRDGGRQQLALFAEEGVDLQRVIVGHCNWYPVLDYLLAVLDTGASIAFDMFGHLDPASVGLEKCCLDQIGTLIERGHASQILLSQDVAFDANLAAFGGHGYTYVQDVVIPALRDRGITQDTIETMTVANPRRLLSVPARPMRG
jgi:phosphotriesterase-related protein